MSRKHRIGNQKKQEDIRRARQIKEMRSFVSNSSRRTRIPANSFF